MDLIWIRAGKEKVSCGSGPALLVPTDKAALLQITETWRRMAGRSERKLNG